jgi:hypothetical protein
MSIATASPTQSPALYEIDALFNSLRKPCGPGEIVRFNLAYQRVYPQLSQTEKRRAEDLVDALIGNLEHGRLASQIYGVV